MSKIIMCLCTLCVCIINIINCDQVKLDSIKNQTLDETINNKSNNITNEEQANKIETITKEESLQMQSFEEWKQLKLKHQHLQEENEIHAKEKNDDSHISMNSNLNNYQGQKKYQEQDELLIDKNNYASMDCGAKIINSNKDASNPSHILTESKDDYMLNSCSSKIWFIIELCEAIKITDIEIANYELFSNIPRLFRIYASDRYELSKDWHKYLINTFEALPIRNIQKFKIMNINEKMSTTHIKYVKFEMLSHYGNEHYCPLSLVRIYGESIDYDDTSISNNNNSINDINEDQNLDLSNNNINSNNNNHKKKDFTIPAINSTTFLNESEQSLSFSLTRDFFRHFLNELFKMIKHDRDYFQQINIILCNSIKINNKCCQCKIIINNSECIYKYLILNLNNLNRLIKDYNGIIIKIDNTNNNENVNHTRLISNYYISNSHLYLDDDLSRLDLLLYEKQKIQKNNISLVTNEILIDNYNNNQHVANKITKEVKSSSNAYLRLSNRIKTLELNMSLSSQYLEKLSQHYRKQIDEMQRIFNKTTLALTEASQIANKRDLYQQDRINHIENKLKSFDNLVNLIQIYLNKKSCLLNDNNNDLLKNNNYYLILEKFTIYNYDLLLTLFIIIIIFNIFLISFLMSYYIIKYLKLKNKVLFDNKQFIKQLIKQELKRQILNGTY
jgi:hypothetical protein